MTDNHAAAMSGREHREMDDPMAEWVKVTRSQGGPNATIHVNLTRAIGLTRNADSTTTIDFAVPSLLPGMGSSGPTTGIRVTETPEEILAQLG